MLRVVAILMIWCPWLRSEVPLNIEYAKNFEIEERDTHSLVTIRNAWTGAGAATRVYALAPKSKDLPELPDGAIVIRTPVERLAITATTFLGPIQELDLHDTLVGIGYVEFANDPIARARVDDGRAIRIQSGSAMDIEALMVLKPELILTSTTGNPRFDTHSQLARAGLPVLVAAAYMEAHPLARTEWIKLFGELFDRREEAADRFRSVSEKYESLVALTRSVSIRPTVFSGAPYGGIWHVAGGRSYSAKGFLDAGADYLWADNDSSGSVPIDIEAILSKAADADFWLNPSSHDSLRALLGADERFVGFRALREKRVYNNTLRVNENGGNDIWERGISHPEEILADLIRIFHPDLLPDHEFVFHERLE